MKLGCSCAPHPLPTTTPPHTCSHPTHPFTPFSRRCFLRTQDRHHSLRRPEVRLGLPLFARGLNLDLHVPFAGWRPSCGTLPALLSKLPSLRKFKCFPLCSLTPLSRLNPHLFTPRRKFQCATVQLDSPLPPHPTPVPRRKFQCATVQLDFQLPIRFGLEYQTEVRGIIHAFPPLLPKPQWTGD